ncbi:hypothetical protein BC828DRAFT_385327 [Blastocladiella britannica]|nr:hypothetical protein BC828DRAFT_385327 [Blastocladiella britannica]
MLPTPTATKSSYGDGSTTRRSRPSLASRRESISARHGALLFPSSTGSSPNNHGFGPGLGPGPGIGHGQSHGSNNSSSSSMSNGDYTSRNGSRSHARLDAARSALDDLRNACQRIVYAHHADHAASLAPPTRDLVRESEALLDQVDVIGAGADPATAAAATSLADTFARPLARAIDAHHAVLDFEDTLALTPSALDKCATAAHAAAAKLGDAQADSGTAGAFDAPILALLVDQCAALRSQLEVRINDCVRGAVVVEERTTVRGSTVHTIRTLTVHRLVPPQASRIALTAGRKPPATQQQHHRNDLFAAELLAWVAAAADTAEPCDLFVALRAASILDTLFAVAATIVDTIFAQFLLPTLDPPDEAFAHHYTLSTTAPPHSDASTLTVTQSPGSPDSRATAWIEALDRVAVVCDFVTAYLILPVDDAADAMADSWHAAVSATLAPRLPPLVLDTVLASAVPDDARDLGAFATAVATHLHGFVARIQAAELAGAGAPGDPDGIVVTDLLAGPAAVVPRFVRARRAAVLSAAAAALSEGDATAAAVRAVINPELAAIIGNGSAGKGKGLAGTKPAGKAGGGGLAAAHAADTASVVSLQHSPEYLVSAGTLALVEMMAQLLEPESLAATAAVTAGAADATAAVVAAVEHVRDILYLWLATVPPRALLTPGGAGSMRHGQRQRRRRPGGSQTASAVSTARRAALARNDADLMVHHLLTVPHTVRKSAAPASYGDEETPADLVACVSVVVDLVPMVRRAGTDVFLAALQEEQLKIADMVKALPPLHDLGNSEDALEDVQASIDEIRLVLGELDAAWRGCLPADVFGEAMDRVREVFCGSVADAVLAMEHISRPAARTLSYILSESVLSGGEFGSAAPAAVKGGSTAAELKIQEIVMILDANSRADGIRASERARGLTKDEVQLLVQRRLWD